MPDATRASGSDAAPSPSRFGLIVILGALIASAPMSIDMYLPALPTLETVFAASAAEVQLTLASFFLGFAVGQGIYGPLADRFGRKPPLYAGLALYAAASAACALAPSVGVLTGLRLVQALGACAGGVTSRAMVRDLFPPQDAARVFSMLMLVMGVAPILAPLVGGYVLGWLGWSAIFWIQAAFGVAVLAAVIFKLPETHRRDSSRSLRPGAILTVYARLLVERRFLGCALAGGISIAGMFAYIAGSPFVFIQLHRLPADQYGWLFGANALGFIAMAQVNARVLRRWSADQVVRAAALVQAASGLLLLAAAASGIGGLAGLAAPLFVYISCIAFILPNTTALAMAPHGQIAGAASALLGMLQFGLAAVVAALVGAIHDGSAVPMAGLIALCSVVAPICYRLLTAPRSP